MRIVMYGSFVRTKDNIVEICRKPFVWEEYKRCENALEAHIEAILLETELIVKGVM